MQEETAYFDSHPAFADVIDVPGLPRVLLLGDSISIGYTAPVRELLAGHANVHRPRANCHSTGKGIVSLDTWLGDSTWDVIVFNFGLHDVSLIKGEPRTRLGLYRNRLRTMLDRIRLRTRSIVWVNTTPITRDCEKRMRMRVVDEPHLFVRLDKDVRRYNAAAQLIMDEAGVSVVDLYAHALPRLAEIQIPRNVHFTEEGYAFLATPIADTIRRHLPQKQPEVVHPK